MSKARYSDYRATGRQDCDNVMDFDDYDDDFDKHGGTPREVVDRVWLGLERDEGSKDFWLSQNMEDIEHDGLDPDKAYEAWKDGWQARAVQKLEYHFQERAKRRADDEVENPVDLSTPAWYIDHGDATLVPDYPSFEAALDAAARDQVLDPQTIDIVYGCEMDGFTTVAIVHHGSHAEEEVADLDVDLDLVLTITDKTMVPPQLVEVAMSDQPVVLIEYGPTRGGVRSSAWALVQIDNLQHNPRKKRRAKKRSPLTQKGERMYKAILASIELGADAKHRGAKRAATRSVVGAARAGVPGLMRKNLTVTAGPKRNPPGYRVPTLKEIAAAWNYIENEFTFSGTADGEQWAEGLAFGRSIDGLEKHDRHQYQKLMREAVELKSQLSEEQWGWIAARADYLAREQGERPKFKENPGIERCTSCGEPTHPSESDDEGRCERCMRAAGVTPIAPDREAALERYKAFHRFDPKDIGEFPSSFKIPAKMKRVGPAKWTTYRSGKVDPATLKRPKRPVNYIHEHDAGVHVYVPVDDKEFAGETVSVPTDFRDVTALAMLGESLGFCVQVDDDEIEAENEGKLPELYCSSDGKCLYIIEDKRELVAMIWGGALGVFPRGIDG